jgi:hypothetical protein
VKRLFKNPNRIAEKIERMSIPEPNSGCWMWTGMLDKAGYGKTSYGSGKTLAASRLSYIVYKCDPEDKIVRHSCDVRSCVNPDHLLVGSQKDNIHDMFNRGRARPRGKSVAGLNENIGD